MARIKRALPVSLVIVTWCVTASAETHRFVPTTFYNTFSFAHPPALRLKPGDTVITVTADAGGMDANDRRVASAPNPQTGPFYVDGAEPGDMLVVTLNRIEPNRGTARSSTLLAPYAVDPAFLRSTAERQARQETWVIDKAKGVARTTSTDLRPGALEFPLIPMLGCIWHRATQQGSRVHSYAGQLWRKHGLRRDGGWRESDAPRARRSRRQYRLS